MTSSLLNNRYRVVAPLGKGGFGITMLAEDTHMPSRRNCVIKQLKPIADNPKIYQFVQDRFGREAAILETLSESTDQIPKLYAYFSEGGRFYLVQELIEGQTLTRKLKTEGPLPERVVRELLAEILSVLSYVHSKGIIHRDIKPDNIMLRQQDGKPVLIDFGAVKELMLHGGEQAGTQVIGSPGFMPTEQMLGRPVFATDLYSLGITAVFMLTGKFPQDLNYDPVSSKVLWYDRRMAFSPALVNVIEKAIQPNPQDRYPTARDMLTGMGDLHLDMLTDQMKRFRKRRPDPSEG